MKCEYAEFGKMCQKEARVKVTWQWLYFFTRSENLCSSHELKFSKKHKEFSVDGILVSDKTLSERVLR